MVHAPGCRAAANGPLEHDDGKRALAGCSAGAWPVAKGVVDEHLCYIVWRRIRGRTVSDRGARRQPARATRLLSWRRGRDGGQSARMYCHQAAQPGPGQLATRVLDDGERVSAGVRAAASGALDDGNPPGGQAGAEAATEVLDDGKHAPPGDWLERRRRGCPLTTTAAHPADRPESAGPRKGRGV